MDKINYNKHDWQNLELITEDLMDNMENGIAQATDKVNEVIDEVNVVIDEFENVKNVKSISNTLPELYLYGATDSMTKETPVMLKADYYDGTLEVHGYVECKWQGSSSIAYPKKNYTIKFYKDKSKNKKYKIDVGFGTLQNKYCLKANFVDHSHVRNILCANLWSDIVASRPDYSSLPEELRNSPNNGAIDGFPIKVFLNCEYQGLYTMNIPKGDWMFGMDDKNPNHFVLCCERNNDGNMEVAMSSQFRNLETAIDGERWSVEVPDEPSQLMLDRLNALISHVKDSDDETFKRDFGLYGDIQSFLDYYLFSEFICHLDGLAKNLLLCCYDGVHLIVSAYDMDTTFGNWWDGTTFVSTDYKCPEQYQENNSLLWQRIKNLYADELIRRYEELREGALSSTNILRRLQKFTNKIPNNLFKEDLEIFNTIPNGENNNARQIGSYLSKRSEIIDWQNKTKGLCYFNDVEFEQTSESPRLNSSNGNRIRLINEGTDSLSSFNSLLPTNSIGLITLKNDDVVEIKIRFNSETSTTGEFSIFTLPTTFDFVNGFIGQNTTCSKVTKAAGLPEEGVQLTDLRIYGVVNEESSWVVDFYLEIIINGIRYI